MRGRTSMPILTLEAWRKGWLLKAGSSPTEAFSATRLPDKTDRSSLPRVTLRPRDVVRADSMRERKLSALRKSGMERTAIRINATMLPRTIRRVRRGSAIQDLSTIRCRDLVQMLLRDFGFAAS